MAENQKRGAVDRINSGVDAFRKARGAYKLARTAGTAAEIVSTSEIWIPVIIIAAIILIIVFIILLGSGGTGIALQNNGGTAPGGGTPGSGNISLCTFTRSGEKKPIKSPRLTGMINDAANAAGIPPAVLASVAMHESQNFLTTYDDNSLEIRNDHYCESEGVSCTSVDRSDSLGPGECTQEHIQADIYRGGSGRVATDYHRGLLQISNYFNPTINACSIKESLTWAANKLKVDGVTAQPIQDQINVAVGRYHGSCDYDSNGRSYSYCNEVWQDYTSCQSSGSASAFGWPTSGALTQGPRGPAGHLSRIWEPTNGNWQAVDIANIGGTKIYSTINGTATVKVCSGTCSTGYGNEIDLIDIAGHTIVYGHFSYIVIPDGSTVTPGMLIGYMGATGHVEPAGATHLHYEFRGLPLAPPNIPLAITPLDCDTPSKPCTPPNVFATLTAPVTGAPQDQYWFVLDRQNKKEYLYKGVPGNKDGSTIVKAYSVNVGIPGERPTPLPRLVGKEYWTIEVIRPTAPSERPTLGNYFLEFDIPYPAPYYGPTPYNECGGRQCNWVIPGEFGLHGINGVLSKLTDAGSSGCVRHRDADIEEIYNTLVGMDNNVRYYIEDGWIP